MQYIYICMFCWQLGCRPYKQFNVLFLWQKYACLGGEQKQMELKRSLSGRMFLRVSIWIQTQTPSLCTAFSSGSTYHPMSSGSRQYYVKSYTDQWQQDGLVSLYLKGKNRTVQILLPALEQSTRTSKSPVAQILFIKVTLKLQGLILSEMGTEIP